MTVQQSYYRKEEVAQLGDEIYRSQISEEIKAGNFGKYAAIDVETGAFEIADDTMVAVKQLRARIPNAQIWMVRIGYRAVHRFGSRSLKDNS